MMPPMARSPATTLTSYFASVFIRSRNSKVCVTFPGSDRARNGMLGSRFRLMHYFDLAIILVYLVAITVFGARFSCAAFDQQ